ncbi:pseudouridine synthase [Luteimonas vadosa]|uniref:RluA family pseudouridine synthase n=1 Tax=Luteimonas vadosa TaxID=1165507 RepID=A0ABP9E986_9GAMM
MPHSLPPSNGVVASRVQLPHGKFASLLDGLCTLFPHVGRDSWQDRFDRGRVMDCTGRAFTPEAPYRVGVEVHYYREVHAEPRMPAGERVLHVDAHLVVADKPHGLPVMPSGRYAAETLHARLVRALGNAHLVPLHRIDRDTAGLVLFSADPRTRRHYHALFSGRGIRKSYEAIAPPCPGLCFPLLRASRLVRGEPFHRMQESQGTPNSLTRIDVLERGQGAWRYGLEPVSGRKHQLRVHMAALGAPILHDGLYGDTGRSRGSDPAGPLQLLAKSLRFTDPIDGSMRAYESGFELDSGHLD